MALDHGISSYSEVKDMKTRVFFEHQWRVVSVEGDASQSLSSARLSRRAPYAGSHPIEYSHVGKDVITILW